MPLTLLNAIYNNSGNPELGVPQDETQDEIAAIFLDLSTVEAILPYFNSDGSIHPSRCIVDVGGLGRAINNPPSYMAELVNNEHDRMDALLERIRNLEAEVERWKAMAKS